MAVYLKLNLFLENRGFKNITEDYGYGKTNAQWYNTRKDILVKRRLLDGVTTVQILQDKQDARTFNISKGEGKATEVQNFKNYIESL